MIENLNKFNLDNEVFVPVYKNNENFKDSNNVCICKCFNKWDRVFFFYKSKKIQKAIEKQYDFSKFELIHAYTLFTDGNVAYELKKKYNIPYVVAIRNTDVNNFFKYMFFLRKHGLKIMKEASAIFFLSNSYKYEVFNKYIPKKYWMELEKKVYIIPNGIDNFWISNRYSDKNYKINNEINIIYAGRIDRNKNIETTQKALEILRKNGIKIKFFIVGKIENKKVFKSIMKYKDTKYLGEKSKEELIDIYRNNDIFVMPSISETFGVSYIEAMSQGLPVIYTKGQGFDGHFEEGFIGYSVKSKSYEDIANKIISICSRYSQISQNCLESVKKFNWEKICNDYIKIYKSLS